MDDFLKIGECIHDLTNVAKQLFKLLLNRGFRLTKWVSNSQEILEQLPKNELKFKEKLEQLSDENKF